MNKLAHHEGTKARMHESTRAQRHEGTKKEEDVLSEAWPTS